LTTLFFLKGKGAREGWLPTLIEKDQKLIHGEIRMPIYEYKCQSCGQTQEILQGSVEAPALKCAHCGSTDFKKLISAAFVSTRISAHNGKTCCGKDERCETPPCSIEGECRSVHEAIG
jgi:putative FmdB family regulatory protein